MSSDAALIVRVAVEADLGLWQRFADEMPDAGCMHHAGWFMVLRHAYRVEPCFLLAVDTAGAIQAILPTYLSKSLLAGRHLSSLEDGVLSRSIEATQAVLETARDLGWRRGAKYLQLRGGPIDRPAVVSVPTVRTVIETNRPIEELWSAVKRKTRWGVRQAEKQGIVVECDQTLKHLDEFYVVYARRMRDLGTPVFGRRTFDSMRRHLGVERLRLYRVTYRGEIIGGMLCIMNAMRWTDYFAVVLSGSEDTEFANYLLYWHVINDAARCSIPMLDLGRSTRHSNNHLFKRKWGGVDIEVPYHFYFASGRMPRNMGLQRMKEQKTAMRRLWSHLPVFASNRLGPIFRRQLPFI